MPKLRRQKGFAIIYVTLIGAFVLIPMAGLAVDFGMLYNIKGRLQTACDAAAIGAGYLLHASTDLTDPTQVAAIRTAAYGYFNANYPTHYFGSTVATPSVDVGSSNAGKSITVTANATVPMLLMRVLGINTSQVAAVAKSNVRYIAMMIAVDRSGSVTNEGAAATIKSALTTFVATAATSYLVDGVDTVGMVSFGGSWKLDYSPNIHFQTSNPSIATAITNIPFDGNSSTNTAEGLYQAWTQLYGMNLPGSLHVIVLLTDGRPSAFTGSFTPMAASTCTSKAARTGVFETYVSLGSFPFWPPPTAVTGDEYGLMSSTYGGVPETSHLSGSNANCFYAANYNNLYKDLSAIPNSVGPVDNVGAGFNPTYTNAAGTGISTQDGYYVNPGTSITNPRAGRYAAFNVADHMATLIRSDATLSPMLFVIGLNYAGNTTEPLDEDWLARVANDPNYVTVGSDTNVVAAGRSVYQAGQTPGMYCNSTQATLSACFSQVTSELLRLIL